MRNVRWIVPALKACLLLLVLVAAAGFIWLYANGGKLLSVQSGSMEPAIRTGDLVSVKSVERDELSVGDVITFMSPDKQTTITHRIVTLLPDDPAGNTIITKGDANAFEDEPIEASSVIGKVEHRTPYLGRGLNFLRSWPGLVLLIYIPAAIVAFSEIRRLATHYRSQYYALPEWLARRGLDRTGRHRTLSLLAAVVLLVAAISPVRAELLNRATLAGNTISVAAPEPEPPAPKTQSSVSLRRVYITCEGERTATHVHMILYNSSRQSADVSGWIIRSDDDTLLTLPENTIVQGGGEHDVKAALIDGISYSNWHLTLHDGENEQKDENIWEINSTRECRFYRR